MKKTARIKWALIIFIILSALFVSSCGKTGSDDGAKADPITVTPFQPSEIPPKKPAPADNETTAAAVPGADTPDPLPSNNDPSNKEPPVTTAPPKIEGRAISESGTLRPEKSDKLSLRIDWTVNQKPDEENATLTMKIYIECYTIYLGERDNGTIKVNGEETTYKTGIITSKLNEKQSFLLTTETRKIPSRAGEDLKLDVSATYDYQGEYGGNKYKGLAVSGSITITK